MNYKLYENWKDTDIVSKVLINRGIENPSEYMSLDESVVIPFDKLDNIDEAAELYLKHLNDKSKISIIVDDDPDGFCSAAMMYMYTKEIDPEADVTYIIHKKAKSHGISNDINIPEGTQLLIVPDAGTNDVNECKRLKESGMDILILDHHEQEKEKNIYAVVVNNMISDGYSNKSFCGAGVVYKFLKAVDEKTWNEYADHYLDLVALANISDVMDMRSFETKYLVELGLYNIKNKMFEALITAQEFSMKGKVNIHNVQWYCTPTLNGMIRVGSLEEKELLFRAFIEDYEEFDYKKRGADEPIKENIYDRAARLSKNAKSRQDKKKVKFFEGICDYISDHENEFGNDKVLVLDATDLIDRELTGVLAINVAEKYGKPCILLCRHYRGDGTYTYGGSARNINYSPLESLKDVVNQTGIATGKGHANAHGVLNLAADQKDDFINSLNSILKDVVYDATYKVDDILDISEISPTYISDCCRALESMVGQGIDEPLVAIENITMYSKDITLIGKTSDTVKFNIDGIEYVKFKCKAGDPLYDFVSNSWDEDDCISMNIVGKLSINDFGGIKIPQIVILDQNVTAVNTDNNTENEEEEWW